LLHDAAARQFLFLGLLQPCESLLKLPKKGKTASKSAEVLFSKLLTCTTLALSSNRLAISVMSRGEAEEEGERQSNRGCHRHAAPVTLVELDSERVSFHHGCVCRLLLRGVGVLQLLQ
jgi:hypothetical protein